MISSKSNAMAEMPRYKSHKQVWALEIERIDHHPDGNRIVQIRDDGFAPIKVPPSSDLFARYQPEPGDFYVVYEDGYKSFSPRKAFLDGYARV